MTLKLNIGSGWKKIDGYVNCDISPVSNPDFVFDLEKDIWPFEDNSVDAVIAYHILEHLGEGYFHALTELYRVCKHGAIVDVRVPHYTHHNFFHDPTHRRPVTPYGLSLFDKVHNYRCPASSSKLGLVFDIDLRLLDYEVRVDAKYQHLQNFQTHVIEEIAFEKNNVIEEYRIQLQVVKWSTRHYKIYEYYRELFDRECSQDDIDYYMKLDCSDEELKLILMSSEEYKIKKGIE